MYIQIHILSLYYRILQYMLTPNYSTLKVIILTNTHVIRLI